jgi:D-glycero-alpha-D-manno-heptose-7-phosphate kinase
MIIRSRAPVRITFAGGGTDIPPYDKEHGGLCIGATVNKYVYASLTPKEEGDKSIEIHSWDLSSKQKFENLEQLAANGYDGKADLIKAVIKRMAPDFGFELFVRSDVGPHSGLGASASAAAAIIGSFNYLRKENKLSRPNIAELAFQIEKDEIKNIGGRQDQYAVVYGGINAYEFKGEDFVRINPLELSESTLLELGKNMLLVYAGERAESSGQVHSKEKVDNKNARLDEVKKVAERMEFILREGDLREFGELIKKSWEAKKGYNPNVANRRIDYLIGTALDNGAIGARLMGAGGGGHILVYCKPNTEQIVAKELEKSGAKVNPFGFDFTGLKIWEAKE